MFARTHGFSYGDYHLNTQTDNQLNNSALTLFRVLLIVLFDGEKMPYHSHQQFLSERYQVHRKALWNGEQSTSGWKLYLISFLSQNDNQKLFLFEFPTISGIIRASIALRNSRTREMLFFLISINFIVWQTR